MTDGKSYRDVASDKTANIFKHTQNHTHMRLNLKGSMFIELEKINSDRWNIITILCDEGIAKKIILDFDPSHNINAKADIGITWRGYGLYPYFVSTSGGGYKLSQNINISDKLYNILKSL